MEKVPDERVRRVVNYDIIPAPDDTVTSAGALWSAKGSSKEKGEVLFNKVVDGLVSVINRDLPP
jgi:creatinine amidohydrolase/Fe(II)-dependent formamide hydrolase-like protein